jgi:hypothetical protein
MVIRIKIATFIPVMESQKNIYDKGPESFLNEKIEHHKTQIKFHRHELDEAKRKLLILTATGPTAPVQVEGDTVIHPDSDFRLKTWKPKVLEALSKAAMALTSDEILSQIDIRLANDKGLRKKAIGAISNSLQTLIREGEVDREDNEGRGNKYIRKSKAPIMTGAL